MNRPYYPKITKEARQADVDKARVKVRMKNKNTRMKKKVKRKRENNGFSVYMRMRIKQLLHPAIIIVNFIYFLNYDL